MLAIQRCKFNTKAMAEKSESTFHPLNDTVQIDELAAVALSEETRILSEFCGRTITNTDEMTPDERETFTSAVDEAFGVDAADYSNSTYTNVHGGERIVDSPEGVWPSVSFESEAEKSEYLARLGAAAALLSTRPESQSPEEIADFILLRPKAPLPPPTVRPAWLDEPLESFERYKK